MQNLYSKGFLDYLKAKGLSPRTLHDYMGYYKYLDYARLESQGQDYLIRYIKRFNNPVCRAMLKSLFSYMRSREDVPEYIRQLAYHFEFPRLTGARRHKELILPNRYQVHEIAKAMPTRGLQLMVLTTFYLGLRLSELLTLKVSDFDWINGTLKIRWEIAKRKKERLLPVPAELQNRLVDYINSELELDKSFKVLFPVPKRTWQAWLERVSKRMEFNMHISPHTLRHACGSYLHEQGLDLKEIAAFLGHTSITTTQIYVHLNKTDLNNKILEAFS